MAWNRSGGPRGLVDRLVWSWGERLPLLDLLRLPPGGLLWPPRCPTLPPAEAFFGRPLAFFATASSVSWTTLVGLLRSPSWLLVGGEAVSEPEEGGLVELEIGRWDLGSGDSSNEKNRESELEFRLGEAPLGRPSMSTGRLCRGSLGSACPGASS